MQASTGLHSKRRGALQAARRGAYMRTYPSALAGTGRLIEFN